MLWAKLCADLVQKSGCLGKEFLFSIYFCLIIKFLIIFGISLRLPPTSKKVTSSPAKSSPAKKSVQKEQILNSPARSSHKGSEEQWIDGPRVSKSKVAEARYYFISVFYKRHQ